MTDVLPYLRCPRCQGPLARGDASLRCPLRHTFNIARQGYVDLAAGPLPHGDAPAMVAAREAFLATGGFDFLGPALAESAGAPWPAAERLYTKPQASAAPQWRGLVVDVGGGTGYHLARMLEALPAAVGLVVDAAKPALQRAARAHPRIAAIRADAWGALPLADHAASVLLDVFAPRLGAELHRVLAADGVLLVATPAPAHLAELHAALASAPGVRLLQIDPDKPERVSATLTPWFRPAGETVHSRRLALARTHARAVVEMGPSAPHTDPAALARAIAALPEPLPVIASIRITRWVPRTQVDRSISSQPRGGS